MARWLRQSTSVDVPIGPFVSATDGFTAQTALTITQPGVRLKKNGGNWAQKNAAQTLSHEENGFYEVTLDATDTDTLGMLRLGVDASPGALPIWEDFYVSTAAVWDALFASALFQANASTIANSAITANAINTGAITNAKFAAGAIDAAAIAADAITAAKVADGTIDAATFAANAITATAIASSAITSAKFGSGAIDANALATDSITAAKIATDAIDSGAMAPSAVTEIVDAVWAKVVETAGSYTAQQALSVVLAALAGVTSNNGATLKTPNGASTRIDATIDGSNNRTAMTVTPSA